MPSIYLKQTGTYTAGSVSVSVSCEAYSPSKLFTRYKHTLEPPKEENIWVYDGQYEWSKYFTLKRDNGYTESKLKEAHVYFNKYDTAKTPLIFVLLFENGVPKAENRYYKASQFKGKFTGSESVEISSLHTYTKEQDILDDLIKENDSLTNLLTYNIGRKEGEQSNGNGNSNYNGNKISVQDESSNGEPKLSDGFKRYKHTPVNGDNGGNKKACVIYNYNLLIGESKSPIDSIQEKTYNYISVYYSNKVFEPLLLELKENGSLSNTNSKYYYHTWKDNEDKSLYWEEIKQSGNVLGVQLDSGSTDVHSALTGSGNKKLLTVLKALELHMQKTIISINKICKFIENITISNLDY